MSSKSLLHRCESILDSFNSIYGTPNKLCLICAAKEYNGKVGVVHKPECLIIELRKAIKEDSGKPKDDKK